MIKLKKDYAFAHNGFDRVEYKEGQETNELPDDIEKVLIERGDACECGKKEKVVEPKIEEKEEKIEEPKESIKEPEENKLVEPTENKKVKSQKKKKK